MGIQASVFSVVCFLFAFGCAWIVVLLVWAHSTKASLDWLEAGFVSLLSVVIFLGWVSVLLASFGQFSLGKLAIVLFGIAGGVFLWRRPEVTMPRLSACSWQDYVLILMLLTCSVVYFRPHEYMLGGTDAGTYVNIGAAIARTGKFVNREPWLAFLGQYRDVTMREQPEIFLTRYVQFLGWYVGDVDVTKMIPQFFPFHPALIAVGMQVGGITGGFWMVPLWSVLGLAAIYFFVRRLFDASTALLTVVLLAITPTHVYFSRYPTAEMLTLLLVFSGMLAFQVLLDTGFADPAWGIFGGSAFGVAFLTRIDLLAIFFGSACVLVLLWVMKQRSAGWRACMFTFAVVSLHAILSALCLNWPYTWNTYGAVFRVLAQQTFLWWVLGLGLVVGILVLVVLRRQGKHGEIWLRKLAQAPWVRVALALCVVFASAYAYFLRPVLEPGGAYTNWASDSQVTLVDGLNWVRIGWYLTPLGLLLATLGVAWMLWTESLARAGFFLMVGLLTTVQYVYKAFIPAFHIYMMRRYVPIVIPTLVISIAYALVTLFRYRKRVAGAVLASALFLGLVGGLVYQSRVVLWHRDWAGAVETVSELAALFEERAVVVMSEPSTLLFADWWGVPLHFAYGYDVATIYQDGDLAHEFVQDLMSDAAETDRPVYLAARLSVAEAVQTSTYLEPLAVVPVALPILMSTQDVYPTETLTDTYTIEVYRVLDEPVNSPLDIDLGTLDVAYVADGFYGKEELPDGVTGRWTSGEGMLDVPVATGMPISVEIRALTSRPGTMSPCEVAVQLDGDEIGRFVLGPEWQTFSFSGVAHPASTVSRLMLSSPTFNMVELGLSPDDRDLGIFVDWVKIIPMRAD